VPFIKMVVFTYLVTIFISLTFTMILLVGGVRHQIGKPIP
jgi:hypothetical protein